MQHQVAIGPEFFAKAKNDYANWHWALVREFMQNSIDAPRSTRIDVTLTNDDDTTTMVVSNDGQPMDRQTLTDKLLSLGGSGKNFEDGSVGGFGKAKEVLYFCHRSYKIETGQLVVSGQGASYDLSDEGDRAGTRSTIVIDEPVVEQLARQVIYFAQRCKWNGRLTLNGTELKCDLNRGRRVGPDFSWCTVHARKTDELGSQMIVRINGIPMYTRQTAINDKVVIVELTGKSGEVLQSSRDSLLWSQQRELDELLQKMAADTKTALARHDPTYAVWEGARLGNNNDDDAEQHHMCSVILDALAQAASIDADKLSDMIDQATNDESSIDDDVQLPVSQLGHQFIIKNTLSCEVPAKYTPDNLSAYANRLAVSWTRTMLTLWKLFDVRRQFSVGFIFSNDRLAEYECTDKLGPVFYINPLAMADEDTPLRRRKPAWTFKGLGAFKIVATAAHEFVHFRGFSAHNEDFTSDLTCVVEPVVLRNAKQFNKCFFIRKDQS